MATLLLLAVDRQQFLTLGLLHTVGRRAVLLVPVLLAQRLTLVLHPPVLKPHFHLGRMKTAIDIRLFGNKFFFSLSREEEEEEDR